MDCRELVEFLTDYLAGELPSPQRARFEEHLAECPDCVAYLKTYQEAVRLGRLACADAADAPEDLVRAILAARLGREPPSQNAKE